MIKNNEKTKIRLLHAVYFLILALTVLYVIYDTDLNRRISISKYDWSGGWTASDGRDICTDDIYAGSEGVTISKVLPDPLGADDSFCFLADNISYSVYVGDDMVCEYTAEENLTGKGYGNIRQSIPLIPQYSGKKITINLRSVFDEEGADTGGDGRIKNVSICPEKVFSTILLTPRLLPAVLSLVVVFFGVLLICIFFAVPRKDLLPFNIASLGMMAILLGMWCLIQTGFLQLILGKTIGFRILTYVLIIFVEIPALDFVNSFTVQKKLKYMQIMVIFWALSLILLFALRFFFVIDMHNSLWIFSASYGIVLAFLGYILMKDCRYCKENGIERDRKYFFAGCICFAAFSAIEIISYVTKEKFIITNGNSLRIGLCLFFFEMLIQFLYWWSGEQEGKELLIRIGFNDHMTGAGNRRAFEQFEQSDINGNKTYGYVMCDINGLKQVNDRDGHEAGDLLIKDVASCLIEVFGEKNVYRLGGDEFAAVTFTDNEDDFRSMTASLREKLNEKKRSASIGEVFVKEGSMDYREVKKTADRLMYDEKDLFYQGSNERRRRR